MITIYSLVGALLIVIVADIVIGRKERKRMQEHLDRIMKKIKEEENSLR